MVRGVSGASFINKVNPMVRGTKAKSAAIIKDLPTKITLGMASSLGIGNAVMRCSEYEGPATPGECYLSYYCV